MLEISMSASFCDRRVDSQPRRVAWTPLLFYGQWLFVLFVSVFDSLLTIRLRQEMMQSELNPLGRALLYLDSGDVGSLIVVKGIGTLLAGAIVLLLYWRRPSWGMAVVSGLALFQFGLLLFLTLR
jgi:hypothetical protein